MALQGCTPGSVAEPIGVYRLRTSRPSLRRGLSCLSTSTGHSCGTMLRMALFTDRRSGTLHDIGMNAAPDHDPAEGLHGWASAHADARAGLAAAVLPVATAHPAPNVLPGMMNAPRRPQPKPAATDWAPQASYRDRASRPAAAASRSTSWSNGSTPYSQTVLPGTPMEKSRQRTQTVLPASRRPMSGLGSFLGQPLKIGASFAQKTRRR